MNESIARLDDMRLVAELTAARNFTDVARRLSVPKQTVARRVAELEGSLGVRLVERTTRTFRLTALGRGYAERCNEVVRLADEVNRTLRGEATDVSGTLRVTADPLFGEKFLPPIVAAFARAHPNVRVDAVLTSRYVDLIEEGFDVAFRVGTPGDPSVVATKVADAAMVFVASPKYLRKHRAPRAARELADHDCIALAPEGAPVRWLFEGGWQPITPRLRVNHLGLAKEAALADLGIANLPQFACSDELRSGKLRAVLASETVAFGAIYVVHLARRLITPRTRAFREIALEQLRKRRELGHIKMPRASG